MAGHPRTCTCERCGAEGPLLDFGFQAPDCVWALPPAQRSPRNNKNFAELDDRRFVRGLLPIRLTSGEEFRVGVWLEVGRDIFDDIFESWDDTVRYPQLKFVATIANAAPPWREKILGVEVHVGVRDQNSRPYVFASHTAWLQQVLERGWTDAEYEAVIASIR
jgi:hypothetical protein